MEKRGRKPKQTDSAILEMLRECDGHLEEAAIRLDLHLRTLRRRVDLLRAEGAAVPAIRTKLHLARGS